MTTDLPTLEVLVLACPRPGEAHARLRASLASSDVGEDRTFCMQKPGQAGWDHWERTHRRAAASRAHLVLVLEDDVVVNRHLAANARSWCWPDHPDFAAGWLYAPGGYARRDTWYSGPREWYGTCGVLYRPAHLARIVDRTMRLHAERPGLPWDSALSLACHEVGRIRVHHPSLVEHPDDVESAVGNRVHRDTRTSRGTFDATWLRSEDQHGRRDRFGRLRTWNTRSE